MPDTVSIDFMNKSKTKYQYLSHFFISNHGAINNYNHLLLLHKILVKTEGHWHINNMKNGKENELKEIAILNQTFHYFDDIININDLGLDNILLNRKSIEIILSCCI